MSREDLIDRILYSYHFEKLFCTLTGRIDRILQFSLLLLGSSVISKTGNPIYVGLAIAFITALQMAYQYGKSSEHSRKQARQYQKLFTDSFELEEAEIKTRLQEIEDSDFSPWMILSQPAILRTRIQQGIQPDEYEPRLTTLEKIIAWLAGDLPQR